MAKAPKAVKVTLKMIVDAGADGMFVKADAVSQMVADLLVEINPTLTNEAGEVACRATQKGIEQMTGKIETPIVTSGFVIESDIPVPDSRRRGRTATMYPFDALLVGQSFFVPNTESKPDAAKSLGSTVSSAIARYEEVIEGEFKENRKGEQVPKTLRTRVFIVKSAVLADGTAGARVWRTQ